MSTQVAVDLKQRFKSFGEVTRQQPCFVCQKKSATLLGKMNYIGLSEGELLLCEDCGHIGIDPIPSADITREGCTLLYALEQKEESPERILRGFMRSYRRGGRFARTYVAPFLAKHQAIQILEIGPGDGYFSQGIKTFYKKAQVSYVDIVEELITYYKAHFDCEAKAGELKKELFPGKKFDLIIFRDLLEHVLDPLTFLRDIESLLSPQGVAFFITPNGLEDAWPSHQYYVHKNRPYVIRLNHFHFYLPQTLDKLLDLAGLEKKLSFKFGLKGHRDGMGERPLPEIDCLPIPEKLPAQKGPDLMQRWKHEPKKIRQALLHNNGFLSRLYSFFSDREKDQVDYYAPMGHEFFVMVKKKS